MHNYIMHSFSLNALYMYVLKTVWNLAAEGSEVEGEKDGCFALITHPVLEPNFCSKVFTGMLASSLAYSMLNSCCI